MDTNTNFNQLCTRADSILAWENMPYSSSCFQLPTSKVLVSWVSRNVVFCQNKNDPFTNVNIGIQLALIAAQNVYRKDDVTLPSG